MMCKIMRFQKLMWCNIMRSTKSKKKTLVSHYSIDFYYNSMSSSTILGKKSKIP